MRTDVSSSPDLIINPKGTDNEMGQWWSAGLPLDPGFTTGGDNDMAQWRNAGLPLGPGFTTGGIITWLSGGALAFLWALVLLRVQYLALNRES